MGFIYKIENIMNSKVYIGQTTQSINRRWNRHRNMLRQSQHSNSHLQNAWNKHGEDNFEFTITEECPHELLNDREIYWMGHYNSLDRTKGYNIRSGGDSYVMSQETRNKIGQSAKRRYANGAVSPMAGKYHSSETKTKMSKAKKGMFMPSGKDHPAYGFKHTQETMQKRSDATISRMTKRNTSGYIGVNFDTSRNKWLVRININGKPKNIGRFDDIIDAAKKYDEECWKLHGNLEYLNFPDEHHISNKTA